jgi:hypothetical protein
MPAGHAVQADHDPGELQREQLVWHGAHTRFWKPAQGRVSTVSSGHCVGEQSAKLGGGPGGGGGGLSRGRRGVRQGSAKTTLESTQVQCTLTGAPHLHIPGSVGTGTGAGGALRGGGVTVSARRRLSLWHTLSRNSSQSRTVNCDAVHTVHAVQARSRYSEQLWATCMSRGRHGAVVQREHRAGKDAVQLTDTHSADPPGHTVGSAAWQSTAQHRNHRHSTRGSHTHGSRLARLTAHGPPGTNVLGRACHCPGTFSGHPPAAYNTRRQVLRWCTKNIKAESPSPLFVEELGGFEDGTHRVQASCTLRYVRTPGPSAAPYPPHPSF